MLNWLRQFLSRTTGSRTTKTSVQHRPIGQMLRTLSQDDTRAQVNLLIQFVTDLFVEVEALREAVLHMCPETRSSSVHAGYDDACHDPTLTQGKGPYQQAYVNAAYVLHNAAGPSPGIAKLLARFYPDNASPEEQEWRETSMLRRLGFSEEEIARFRNAAEEAQCFS